MIYGHGGPPVDGWGLRELSDVTVDATPAVLRELAAFLTQAAGEMERDDERGVLSTMWHKHAPADLTTRLGGDVVVTPAAAHFNAADA